MENQFYLEIESHSQNEQFARMVVAAYVVRLNPTVEEMEDLKTAVSEAVTNCIIHGYEEREGKIVIEGKIVERTVTLLIRDFGKGIENVALAMSPFYTTKPDMERSGMGFTFMESFTDGLKVESHVGEGTSVTLTKTFL
jgi:stage II sporulation protein AB (anti-sigma F factor)